MLAMSTGSNHAYCAGNIIARLPERVLVAAIFSADASSTVRPLVAHNNCAARFLGAWLLTSGLRVIEVVVENVPAALPTIFQRVNTRFGPYLLLYSRGCNLH